MRKYSFLVWAMFSFVYIEAQIFVNTAAIGNNDGSSWENAYVELSTAIAASQEGDEIWVAAGNYLPGGNEASRDSFFSFDHNVNLYGGFSGVERTLDERGDYKANPTILNGDVEGDDIAGNFTENRDDNCRHVMYLDSYITNEFVLDGFFIQNGHSDDGNASGNDRRAGGVLSYGSPIIQNCTFLENYGFFAGALYPRSIDASGIRVRNCEFFGNHAGGTGGAMYIFSIGGGRIENCLFEGNTSENSGGAIYNHISTDTIINCEFISNQAGTDSRGGGIYVTESFVLIENADFLNNDAVNRTGGGVHLSSDEEPCEAYVRNCNFRGNTARWGAGLTAYGRSTLGDISNCRFFLNESSSNGGGISIGFRAQLKIDSCLFEENRSSSNGGAIYMQNDNSSLQIRNSRITSNTAGNDGGGLATFAGAVVTMFNTVFESNFAALGSDGGFGGAISMVEDSLDLATLNVNSCQLIANYASDQGGAISIIDVDANINNSLIVYNTVGAEGIAGAISHNASGTRVNPKSTLELTNNTIALNEGLLAAGVVAWEGAEGGDAEVTLQNNIFYNPSYEEIAIEEGDPTFISNGGNLALSANAVDYLDDVRDLIGADPSFIDVSILDFNLGDMSPCINSGVSNGAPSIDIRGLPRDEMVDMGCYEKQSSSQLDLLATRFFINAYPTVSQGRVRIQGKVQPVEGNTIEARVFAVNGVSVWKGDIPAVNGVIDHEINLDNLLPGRYFLRLFPENGIMEANLILVE